eukprot:1752312-Pleurochrysis_carterae.AAC.2
MHSFGSAGLAWSSLQLMGPSSLYCLQRDDCQWITSSRLVGSRRGGRGDARVRALPTRFFW